MASNVRPVLDAYGFWSGRDLYRAMPALTRDLSLQGLIRRTVPFCRLLWQVIDRYFKITRIPTGYMPNILLGDSKRHYEVIRSQRLAYIFFEMTTGTYIYWRLYFYFPSEWNVVFSLVKTWHLPVVYIFLAIMADAWFHSVFWSSILVYMSNKMWPSLNNPIYSRRQSDLISNNILRLRIEIKT